MKSLVLVFVFGLALALNGCRERPETLVSRYDQQAMDAAIARARAEVDEFLQVLGRNDADSFSVKVPITDPNGTEHFWLDEVRYEAGAFIGRVANEPGVVRTVAFGQEWRVKKEEISDWMFTRGDRIHGGYTIDPLLGSWSKPEADALRARLVR